jgi:hypothetical protein
MQCTSQGENLHPPLRPPHCGCRWGTNVPTLLLLVSEAVVLVLVLAVAEAPRPLLRTTSSTGHGGAVLTQRCHLCLLRLQPSTYIRFEGVERG